MGVAQVFVVPAAGSAPSCVPAWGAWLRGKGLRRTAAGLLSRCELCVEEATEGQPTLRLFKLQLGSMPGKRFFMMDRGSGGGVLVTEEEVGVAAPDSTEVGLNFLLQTLHAYQRSKFTCTFEQAVYEDSDWAVRIGSAVLLKQAKADFLEVEFKPLDDWPQGDQGPSLFREFLRDLPATLPAPLTVEVGGAPTSPLLATGAAAPSCATLIQQYVGPAATAAQCTALWYVLLLKRHVFAVPTF